MEKPLQMGRRTRIFEGRARRRGQQVTPRVIWEAGKDEAEPSGAFSLDGHAPPITLHVNASS